MYIGPKNGRSGSTYSTTLHYYPMFSRQTVLRSSNTLKSTLSSDRNVAWHSVEPGCEEIFVRSTMLFWNISLCWRHWPAFIRRNSSHKMPLHLVRSICDLGETDSSPKTQRGSGRVMAPDLRDVRAYSMQRTNTCWNLDPTTRLSTLPLTT